MTYPYMPRTDVVVPAQAYDRRITIQHLSQTPDGLGGFVNTWVRLVSTWAHIEPWKGAEHVLGQQIYPNLWLRMLMRYRYNLNINATMRVVYKDRIFNIRSVYVPAEASRIIELLCEELQAKGST